MDEITALTQVIGMATGANLTLKSGKAVLQFSGMEISPGNIGDLFKGLGEYAAAKRFEKFSTGLKKSLDELPETASNREGLQLVYDVEILQVFADAIERVKRTGSGIANVCMGRVLARKLAGQNIYSGYEEFCVFRGLTDLDDKESRVFTSWIQKREKIRELYRPDDFEAHQIIVDDETVKIFGNLDDRFCDFTRGDFEAVFFEMERRQLIQSETGLGLVGYPGRCTPLTLKVVEDLDWAERALGRY